MPERALSASVLAAIASGSLRPFLLFEGEYVSGGAAAFLRLFTGVGTLSWDGKQWVGGRDLLSISPVRESTSLEAIGFSVRLSGMPADKLSLFLQSMRKNRPGKLWLGFVGDEVVESGTAQAGSANTLTLAAGASSLVNAHARKTLRLPTGPGSVQERPVSAYDGGTKVATVSPRWRTNLIVRSEELDNAAWSKRANVTVTPNQGVGDFADLDKIENSVSGGATNGAFQISAFTAIEGEVWRWSGWLASVSGETTAYLRMGPAGGPTSNQQSFTVTTTPQRFSISFTVPANPSDGMYGEFSPGFAGVAILAGRGQLERAADLGDYIKTVAAAITLPDATTGYEVIDPNGIIPDPYPLRRGRFDVAPISRDPGSGTMTIEARYEGPLARLLVPNVRHYTHEDQQLRLAGDKGFDQVEELQDTQDIWGPEVPVYPKTSRMPRQPSELA